jgi:hypothetical protein
MSFVHLCFSRGIENLHEENRMLDDSFAHHGEMIHNASQLMSHYFQKAIHFSHEIDFFPVFK